ncbi:MAG: tyrosine-protein phosphatase [Bacteroidales bacterium]|nr:tyrosine-protein phosphatase [Bacteroidales bacterium]
MGSLTETNISFKTILNFRDAGGLPAMDGRIMKTGMIFRSATPDNLGRREVQKLHNLNIRTIIDLRGPNEDGERKNRFDEIEVISLPLDFEGETRRRMMPFFYEKNSLDKIAEISAELYLEILDASVPVFRNVVEILLTPGKSPVLIHCKAGKDRTGIMIALIHMALDIKREAIIDNFMKSNEELIPFFREKLLLRRILSFGFFPADAVMFAVTVRKENIEAVIDRVNNHYGGIASFLNDPAGEKIKKLKDLYLVN